MFVAIPTRHHPTNRWAVFLLLTVIASTFIWSICQPTSARDSFWLDWGALSAPFISSNHQLQLPLLQDGSIMRLFTALFLHADWSHLLGTLAFLLIFGLPAERRLGSWRMLILFLCGGALANLAAILAIGTREHVIIGASGAVSAVIGAYLTLFPSAKLGVVVPLGLFLEFIRMPAPLLIGLWAILQLVFTSIGPTYGHVAWAAHLAGFIFGVIYGLIVRTAIARRTRKFHGF